MRKIKKVITSLGFRPVAVPGAERTAIGIIGNQGWIDESPFAALRGIREIIHVTKPYKLVGRDFHPSDTVIKIDDKTKIGGKNPLVIIAGPCAIESREQIFKTARYLKRLGVPILRGGAFKPRTSPHSFQGMREEGIEMLDEIRSKIGIKVVTEVMSPEYVSSVASRVDMLQVGARNMQNYDLLREVGRTKNPVILKRGLSSTVEEWLASAEYILLEGNRKVILCERGIRTFETSTRNTADLSVIPLVKKLTHLPVIFDPSHATGKRDLVYPMAQAASAVGAHGVMIEVHPDPEHALSDGSQSLDLKEFRKAYARILQLAGFIKKNRL
ncbi:MAG: 3-deoxy-7-phosphoheptulonate synthase [Nitrospirota bacterium]|nr:MAG: 3-deoxy-7-phosphoheptulonate synthase [Nitrospirota bacterium]